jgi:hypothetical protein
MDNNQKDEVCPEVTKLIDTVKNVINILNHWHGNGQFSMMAEALQEKKKTDKFGFASLILANAVSRAEKKFSCQNEGKEEKAAARFSSAEIKLTADFYKTLFAQFNKDEREAFLREMEGN